MTGLNREKILASMLKIIEENPGIRPRDLNRKLGMEHSNHYRQTLIKQGRIYKKRDGSAVRYYLRNK